MSLTVRDGLARLSRLFHAHGIEGAPREARRILAHALQVEPGRLTVMAGDPLDPGALDRALALAARRAEGTPMSHILGWREFWGRRFAVDGRVLDPRPETECLVELALAEPFDRVLDLGTGSGCILLTLLAERPGATGLGIDISGPALEVAAQNAAALGVAGRVRLMPGDWFAGVDGRFDLVVSNPPYIAVREMAGLQPEVRAHEPHVALTDGGDGLGAYRRIAAGLADHLAPGGRVLLEIGPEQGAAVSALLAGAGLRDVAVHPDLDGRDRVVSARNPAPAGVQT